MLSQSHQSGHDRFSIRERRLLRQVGVVAPEAPRGRPRNVSENTRVFLEHLSLEIQRRELRGTEKTEFYRARVTTLTREQLEELDTWIRGGVGLPEVFQQVFRRDAPEHQEVLDITKQQLDVLKTSIGGVVKSGFETSMRYAEKVADFVLPERLTESMTQTQKRVFGTAATLGTALLVGWIAHAVLRGREAAGEKREKTKGGFFKKLFWGTLVGVGAGLAAFFGFRLYGKYREFEQKAEEFRRSMEETRRAMEEKKEKVTEAARTVVAGVRQAGEGRVEGLTHQTREVEDEIPEYGHGMGEGYPEEVLEETRRERKPEYALSPEIEQAVNASEVASRGFVAAGLLLLHKDLAKQAGINFANEEEPKMVNAVLQRPVVRRLRVGDLQRARSGGDIVALTDGAKFSEEEKHALYFLALVTQESLRTSHVQELLRRTGKSPDDMQLADFLDTISVSAKLVAKFNNALRGKDFKDVRDMKPVLDAVFASEDIIHELGSHPILSERLKALHPALSDRKLAAHFAFYCLGPGQKGGSILRHIIGEEPLDETDGIFKEALRNVRGELLGDEAMNYLLQYMVKEEHVETMRGYLMENLSVADAVQLYMGLQLVRMDGAERAYPEELENSNALGALFLQMKLLSILRNVNRDQGIAMRTRLLMDLPAGSLKIPREAQRMFSQVVQMAGSKAVEWLWEWGELAKSEVLIPAYEAHMHPTWRWPTWGAEGVVGVGGGWGIYKFLKWRNDFANIMANRLGGWGMIAAIQKKVPAYLRLSKTAENAWNPQLASHMADTIRGTEDAIRNLPSGFQKTAQRSLNRLHYRGTSPHNYEQFYREIGALRSAGADPGVIDEIVEKAKIMEQHGPAMLHRRYGYFRRQFWGASPWQRFMWVGAGVAHGVEWYRDFEDVQDAYRQRVLVERHVESVMSDVGNRLSADPRFARVESRAYRHRESGVIVELCVPRSVRDFLDGRVGAEYAELATTTAGALTTLLMGARMFAGPAGLIVVGVELGVRGGIAAWKEGQMRRFVEGAPPWLIVRLGMGQILRQSEYDILAKASAGMLSDVFPSLDEANKREVRRKMLLAIFRNDLVCHAPEILGEIMADKTDPIAIDQFYEQDFRNIVLPFFSAFLFEEVGGRVNLLTENLSTLRKSMSWEAFREGRIDSGDLLLPANATFVEVRTAMRKATILYLQHLREQRYMDLMAYYEQQRAAFGATEDPALDGRLEALRARLEEYGHVKVFGREISELTFSIVEENRWKTRTERLLEELLTTLDTSTGHLLSEKLQHRPDLFLVRATEVAGLSEDVDTRSLLLQFIDDPVLREKLSLVFPETTEEKEGAPYPSWKEWYKGESWMKWLTPMPEGVGREERIVMAQDAARTVLKELGEELPEDATFDAARHAITQDSLRFFEKREGEPALVRDAHLESRLYAGIANPPIVLSRLQHRFNVISDYPELLELCQQVSIPNAHDRAFSVGNVKVVIVEGKVLKNGEKVALATFVYGDLEGKENVRIVQQGAATSKRTRERTSIAGMALASSAGEFLTQQGSQGILERARAEWLKELPDRREREESTQREKEQRERAREQKGEEIEARRATAMEEILKLAKMQPNVLHPYDGSNSYVAHLPEHGFVYVRVPEVDATPVLRAAEGTPGHGGPFSLTRITREGRPALVMRGDYVTHVEKQRQPSTPYTEALVLPISGKPRESVRKILAVFVESIASGEAVRMENALVPLYETLTTDEQRVNFLSTLRTAMYQETRVKGRPSSEWRYLTPSLFENVRKRIGGFGERKAA